jgi:hypothetical protein
MLASTSRSETKGTVPWESFMMTSLVHPTAAYSNAVLVAIMPYVSDFAKKSQLVIISKKIDRPSPKVDVEPELESDYQKPMKPATHKMFIRTNAPPRLIRPKPSPEDHD